ncbi:metalloregulator ArsR/SmtB family transcription factor [Shouchella clausii]|uniref:helix-turn-helix transcriptional regulator n=1 Tax=Shouchella clausii TaxID=79880 RepID=UPI000BA6328C|nr:metalloregulator ArsR/SmtB family transcription factor [Shouchella clausii]PAD91051.1 transcriptional regulator [Shouchella clausii]PAF15130.1 transcriptional regulator [Shouchella clausii]
MEKQTTKEKILELLKKQVEMSVGELTDALGITHMAVRKHLNVLLKDGFIQFREIKQEIGRPLQMFSISEKGDRLFPKNYEGLTVDFLHDIQDLHGDESIHYLFKKRELRLTDRYFKRMVHKSPEEKMAELAKIQNEKGYMAEVTQHDAWTFELVEHNCPVFAVAKQFKAACQCETSLFKNVLETESVKRVACQSDGDTECRFVMAFSENRQVEHR